MNAHLEPFAHILVQSTVIIQNVNELEVVPLSNGIIIRIVRWRDFDRTGSELHVDDDIITNNWHLPIRDERMFDEFSVEVLVPRVIGVDSNGRITKHSLRARSSDGDPLVRALDGVRERCDHTEHDGFVISGDIDPLLACALNLVEFEVGECSVESYTPVDEPICASDDPSLVEGAEGFDHGF